MLKAKLNKRTGWYECKGYIIQRPQKGEHTQWCATLERGSTLEANPTLATFLVSKTLKGMCAAIGRQQVTTRNILNPNAGDIQISWEDKGGCCDPGTETYHSM